MRIGRIGDIVGYDEKLWYWQCSGKVGLHNYGKAGKA